MWFSGSNRKSLLYTSFSCLTVSDYRKYDGMYHYESRGRRFSNERNQKTVWMEMGNWAFFSRIEIYDWINEFPCKKGGVYLAGNFCPTDHLQLLWKDYHKDRNPTEKQEVYLSGQLHCCGADMPGIFFGQGSSTKFRSTYSKEYPACKRRA